VRDLARSPVEDGWVDGFPFLYEEERGVSVDGAGLSGRGLDFCLAISDLGFGLSAGFVNDYRCGSAGTRVDGDVRRRCARARVLRGNLGIGGDRAVCATA
jgi:hypothetical protein